VELVVTFIAGTVFGVFITVSFQFIARRNSKSRRLPHWGREDSCDAVEEIIRQVDKSILQEFVERYGGDMVTDVKGAHEELRRVDDEERAKEDDDGQKD
jgi:hypothetical protein